MKGVSVLPVKKRILIYRISMNQPIAVVPLHVPKILFPVKLTKCALSVKTLILTRQSHIQTKL